MPTYEYQCRECAHTFEVVQRMSDESLETCPDCNQDTLHKLISAVGFQLKGTGWYETDFKNSGKPPAKKVDGGDDGAAGTGDKSTTADKSDNSSTTVKGDSAPKTGDGTGSKTTETTTKTKSTPAAD